MIKAVIGVFQNVWMKIKCSDDQMRPSSNGRRRGVELTGSGDMMMCPHGHLVSALPVLTCHIPHKTRIIRSDESWATGLIVFFPLGYLWGSKRNSWYSGNFNLQSGKGSLKWKWEFQIPSPPVKNWAKNRGNPLKPPAAFVGGANPNSLPILFFIL